MACRKPSINGRSADAYQPTLPRCRPDIPAEFRASLPYSTRQEQASLPARSNTGIQHCKRRRILFPQALLTLLPLRDRCLHRRRTAYRKRHTCRGPRDGPVVDQDEAGNYRSVPHSGHLCGRRLRKGNGGTAELAKGFAGALRLAAQGPRNKGPFRSHMVDRRGRPSRKA
jgi:hypothetical protein